MPSRRSAGTLYVCPCSTPRPVASATRAPGQSEDCLHLNIWAPADAEGAPVLVWFYGGSFLFGSGSDPRCDGTTFVPKECHAACGQYLDWVCVDGTCRQMVAVGSIIGRGHGRQ